jgi:hypothetical protein
MGLKSQNQLSANIFIKHGYSLDAGKGAR